MPHFRLQKMLENGLTLVARPAAVDDEDFGVHPDFLAMVVDVVVGFGVVEKNSLAS